MKGMTSKVQNLQDIQRKFKTHSQHFSYNLTTRVQANHLAIISKSILMEKNESHIPRKLVAKFSSDYLLTLPKEIEGASRD